MDHNTSGWLASLRKAETTVAYLPARWTHPTVVPKRLTEILSIAIYQTRTTKLSTHASAVLVATDGFGVDGLLPALVAGGAPHTIVDLVRASFNGMYGTAIVGDRAVHFNGEFVFFRYDPSSPGNGRQFNEA